MSETKTVSTFDILSQKLEAAKLDTGRLRDVYEMLWECAMLLTAPQFRALAAELESTSQLSEEVNCWFLLSNAVFDTFFPSSGTSSERLEIAREAFGRQHLWSGEGATKALLAIYYKNLGQLDKAQGLVQESIRQIGNDRTYLQFSGIAHYQAGEMHYMLKDYPAAIRYYSDGLKQGKEGTGISLRLLVGLAVIYKETHESEKAYEFLQKALDGVKGRNNNILESKIYADLADYHFRKKELDLSVKYHHESIAIREKHNMKNPLITNYTELAEVLLAQNKPEEAIHYVKMAEELSHGLNIVLKLNQVYLTSASIYEAIGDHTLALEYFKKYHKTKEEVFSQESARKIKELSVKHEMETMEQEKELFKLRNVVLKEALDEIGASVRYALRIQQAILPPVHAIKEKLPDTFVLYKPKDVVAGDFYWMFAGGSSEIGVGSSESKTQNNNLRNHISELRTSNSGLIFIAAADCTGHGVPGAMLSVVCSNALNRAVKEFNLRDTGAILDKVTDLVLETFESSEEVKDGMDISILAVDKAKKKVYWSGANNPLWYFYKGTVNEIEADKQPVGKSDFRKPFTTHTIDYHEGSTFYLFTDGYADQFGGPYRKKYKYSRFRETLASICDKAAETQWQELNLIFESWKGDMEQVDDVCVIGIRL